MRYEILKPDCYGCGRPIDTPAECDMELFRLGVPVHLKSECMAKAEERVRQETSHVRS